MESGHASDPKARPPVTPHTQPQTPSGPRTRMNSVTGLPSQKPQWNPGYLSPTILEGGFEGDKRDVMSNCYRLRGFPPPSNADYGLSPDHKGSHDLKQSPQFGSSDSLPSIKVRHRSPTNLKDVCRHPRDFVRSIPELDGVTKLLEKSTMQAVVTNLVETDFRSKGEKLADTINFYRRAWITDTPGVSGILIPAEEQRLEFIGEINDGGKLEFCTVCEKMHIPPGPTLTLQDRDTCGSYLPKWFPTDKINKPWDAFTGLMNEYILLNEVTQGYNHRVSPDRKIWDLHFHEPHEKWKEVGRKTGWWKCRAGPEAPLVERDCNICHRLLSTKSSDIEEGFHQKSAAERKADIMAFIEKRMRAIGDIDKTVALAHIRAEGLPQHFGIRHCPPNVIPPIPHLDMRPQELAEYFPHAELAPTEICFDQARSRRKRLEF